MLDAVKRPAFCERHDRVVGPDELVLGFEVAPGHYVPIEDTELAAVAPEDTKTIEISSLVPADCVDPAMVERTYYLSAAETPIGRRPYVLLHQLLVQRHDVALARLVNRGHEWVAAIAPHASRNVLLLQKLALADDFVHPTEIEVSLRDVELQDGELELGRDLAAKMGRTKPSPQAFQSDERSRVQQLVDAKLAGGALVAPERAEPETQTPPIPGVRPDRTAPRLPRPAQARTRRRGPAPEPSRDSSATPDVSRSLRAASSSAAVTNSPVTRPRRSHAAARRCRAATSAPPRSGSRRQLAGGSGTSRRRHWWGPRGRG